MLRAFAKKLVELFACGGDGTATPKASSANVQFVRLQTTAKLYISAVLIACCSLMSLDAQAVATIDIVQNGSTVTVTYGGTLKVPQAPGTTYTWGSPYISGNSNWGITYVSTSDYGGNSTQAYASIGSCGSNIFSVSSGTGVAGIRT
jgi:hypothetical protein